MKLIEPKIIAVDFDGTCVTHEYPNVGRDIGAAQVLRDLVKAGHRLILWTMRSDGSRHGDMLTAAVQWFETNAIPLYAAGRNPEQDSWTSSNKAYAHLYIDDAALGCPLVRLTYDRPHVDWVQVRQMLVEQGYLPRPGEGVDTDYPIVQTAFEKAMAKTSTPVGLGSQSLLGHKVVSVPGLGNKPVIMPPWQVGAAAAHAGLMAEGVPLETIVVHKPMSDGRMKSPCVQVMEELQRRNQDMKMYLETEGTSLRPEEVITAQPMKSGFPALDDNPCTITLGSSKAEGAVAWKIPMSTGGWGDLDGKPIPTYAPGLYTMEHNTFPGETYLVYIPAEEEEGAGQEVQLVEEPGFSIPRVTGPFPVAFILYTMKAKLTPYRLDDRTSSTPSAENAEVSAESVAGAGSLP